MLLELKLHLKRKLISNGFIWKIRHYLQPSWIENYKSKDSSRIVNKILMINPKSIIDFGCGSGNTLFKIKQSRPEIVILGIDISSKAINFCKISTLPNHQEVHDFKIFSKSSKKC